MGKTGEQQVPWESSSLTGDFYFVPGAASPSGVSSAAETPSPSSATDDKELVFWQAIQDSGNPKSFEAYGDGERDHNFGFRIARDLN